ncbi:OB-fold-containig protein [Aeoliella mucimassa]|uniref:Inner membrane protein YqiJ N-terminal domain-containing protein n=1 Tax=Aeoliella mucimassa TaxID=2527972 RepID=A0A518AQD7_9BACT|nr:OB-fold-containig protein [Aeoliella mucimassa]QDU56933.1 hypothetical protein Pan181_31450 [Aeoliella mucimassa]
MQIEEHPAIFQFFEYCLAWPVMPASTLMALILIYGLIALLGAADLDLFEFDVDVDVDVDGHAGSATSVGLVVLKFLNLGDVPIIIWLACFGLFWWSLSLILWVFFDGQPEDLTFWGGAILVFRNAGISLLGAKGLTEPLREMFDETEQYTPQKLIGRLCEVSTYEVTDQGGQARIKTDAAPLLIDVRTEDDPLHKGDIATVVAYDAATKTYQIKQPPTEIIP